MDIISGRTGFDLSPFDGWTTFPPQERKLWLTSTVDPSAVAVGDYRVVLSFGPGSGFVMAYDVESYKALGIPFAERGLSLDPASRDTADRPSAEQAAIAAIELADGEVLMWCGDLILTVGNLDEARDQPPPAFDGQRIIDDLNRIVPDTPMERPTTMEENRDLYAAMTDMDIADHVLETMLFVLALDEQELEISRNHVHEGDLVDFARLYHLMPSWPQRCAIAYVLQDQDAPALIDVQVNILKAPRPPEPLSLCHIAQAAALGTLRKDLAWTDRYLDDPDLLDEHAAVWSTLHGN